MAMMCKGILIVDHICLKCGGINPYCCIFEAKEGMAQEVIANHLSQGDKILSLISNLREIQDVHSCGKLSILL
jgi:hypothetical protein